MKKTTPIRACKTPLKKQKNRTVSQQRWLLRQLNDPYVAQAKHQGYRTRAAFKILQIHEKFKLLRPGMCVVDLGAAPGGWSQVIAQEIRLKTTPKSQLIAVDLQELEPIPGITALQADFTKPEALEHIDQHLNGRPVDVILTDMAAPACGIPSVDHLRIMQLLEDSFNFAIPRLCQGGTFVGKVLQGGTEQSLLTSLKKNFQKVHHFKPDASRKDSAEMYLVALEFSGTI